MTYGWEGNRRSGVALAMRHRLRAQGLGEGDEYLTKLSDELYLTSITGNLFGKSLS